MTAAAAPMLAVEGLDVAYGDFQVLWEAELRVNPGEITTTGDATSRLVRLTVNVQYRGQSVTDESWLIADTAD